MSDNPKRHSAGDARGVLPVERDLSDLASAPETAAVFHLRRNSIVSRIQQPNHSQRHVLTAAPASVPGSSSSSGSGGSPPGGSPAHAGYGPYAPAPALGASAQRANAVGYALAHGHAAPSAGAHTPRAHATSTGTPTAPLALLAPTATLSAAAEPHVAGPSYGGPAAVAPGPAQLLALHNTRDSARSVHSAGGGGGGGGTPVLQAHPLPLPMARQGSATSLTSNSAASSGSAIVPQHQHQQQQQHQHHPQQQQAPQKHSQAYASAHMLALMPQASSKRGSLPRASQSPPALVAGLNAPAPAQQGYYPQQQQQQQHQHQQHQYQQQVVSPAPGGSGSTQPSPTAPAWELRMPVAVPAAAPGPHYQHSGSSGQAQRSSLPSSHGWSAAVAAAVAQGPGPVDAGGSLSPSAAMGPPGSGSPSGFYAVGLQQHQHQYPHQHHSYNSIAGAAVVQASSSSNTGTDTEATGRPGSTGSTGQPSAVAFRGPWGPGGPQPLAAAAAAGGAAPGSSAQNLSSSGSADGGDPRHRRAKSNEPPWALAAGQSAAETWGGEFRGASPAHPDRNSGRGSGRAGSSGRGSGSGTLVGMMPPSGRSPDRSGQGSPFVPGRLLHSGHNKTATDSLRPPQVDTAGAGAGAAAGSGTPTDGALASPLTPPPTPYEKQQQQQQQQAAAAAAGGGGSALPAPGMSRVGSGGGFAPSLPTIPQGGSSATTVALEAPAKLPSPTNGADMRRLPSPPSSVTHALKPQDAAAASAAPAGSASSSSGPVLTALSRVGSTVPTPPLGMGALQPQGALLQGSPGFVPPRLTQAMSMADIPAVAAAAAAASASILAHNVHNTVNGDPAAVATAILAGEAPPPPMVRQSSTASVAGSGYGMVGPHLGPGPIPGGGALPRKIQTMEERAAALEHRREQLQKEEEAAEAEERETLALYSTMQARAKADVEGAFVKYTRMMTLAGRHSFCAPDELYNLIMTPHDALLMSHIAKPLLRIIDCRRRDEYLQEHVRGALHLTDCTTAAARAALNTTPLFEQRAAALDPRNSIVFYGTEELEANAAAEAAQANGAPGAGGAGGGTGANKKPKYTKLHAKLVQVLAMVDDGVSRLLTLRGGIEAFKAQFPFLVCRIPHDVVPDLDGALSELSGDVSRNDESSGHYAASLAGSWQSLNHIAVATNGAGTTGRKRTPARRRDVHDRAAKKQTAIAAAAEGGGLRGNAGARGPRIPGVTMQGIANGLSEDQQRYGRNYQGPPIARALAAGLLQPVRGKNAVYCCPFQIPRSEMAFLRMLRQAEGGDVDESEFAGTLQNGHKIPGTSAFEFDPDLNVYPNLILDAWLFLGDQRCSWSLASLIDLQITHIINISTDICNYFEDHPAARLANGRSIKYLTIRMHDDQNSDIMSQFALVFSFIDMAKKTDKNARVFVHCQMGISRSASLIIAYVMHLTRQSLKDIYYFLKMRRYIVQPNRGFWAQLGAVEKQLRNGQSTVHEIIESGMRKEDTAGCDCCTIC